MTEPEFIEKMVCALRKVPPKQLKIIEFANRFTTEEGDLDHEAVDAAKAEVNLAVVEAKNYGRYTEAAVGSLRRLEAIPGEA